MTKREPVAGLQPELLRWARETVGLSVEDAAIMCKVATADVAAWEAGYDAPTYAQLEKLAYQVYKRPLAVFFLPTPPEEHAPQREFRTLPQSDMQSLARDTYLQIRRAHAFQLSLDDVFAGHNPADAPVWKAIRLSPLAPIVEQAKRVRDALGITLQEQSGWKSDELALKRWRKAVEEAGVFVFKSSFKQEDISGFCLIDDTFPLIYLNNGTTKTRQTFSMLHELAHILLGVNGLSKFDPGYIDHLPQAERNIERFCNAIAAEVLIPSADFSRHAAMLPGNAESASERDFSDLAGRYGVSREAILRCLLDQGRVSASFYRDKADQWASQKKERAGGSYYLNQGAYVSDRFAREVVGRHYQHQLTLEQAADFLGIKPRNFAGFEERVLHGAET
ncbi:ImmA/IrrE family metallo-endopeptidase [Burkholderia sp. FERM BP-3421]|jgi:Zn-dependent peptidase ImmA (M78 family)/transcriptional regulator with XRE-family HTH domain|uniref:ImmA/IrrE family metallo-endopeptidase n=1 Tax=Burkholderia sp. FERM BP-3421 TaxID=1494466 RepID=UPI00235FAA48|nr:ImmA/IrrE family metallo-endopeptidase [Burkholderia sp. FERM BP-3421]WDD90847.1 ImmA/IrrE family metallo-endopeptidase [Burkholderia sp. FERM BP-3421]